MLTGATLTAVMPVLEKVYIDKGCILLYLVGQTYRIYPSDKCPTIVSHKSDMEDAH